MKKIATTGFFACLSMLSFSQQNTVSSGGEAIGSGGTVSYSVGQIDYTNSQGTNGSINQGVQQPYEFYELGIKEAQFIDVLLFPNPTNEFIILQFENFTSDLSYSLYDLNGKIVVEGIVEASETQIDMRTFAKGQYNLTIRNSTNNIQSIKIVKN
ncbi:MAG: T9SS type A sorting domain-containing protein [Crocinitomicaceae bacterium]|nr:T9SS type A sorting domain-containing protein [Crocinitomicaceae bacterium]